MTPRHYLLTMLAAGAAAFAMIWAWVAAMPMTYMEPEFAAWQAKLAMLDRCDVGDTLILGDSRAASGILPARLADRTTNLAIGGGEAIEALALLRRALACPRPPRRVILSFDAGHFSRADLFWERSVRFRLLAARDIAELRRISRATADSSVYEERHTDLIPAILRDWLYRVHFPTYDFASLLHGGGFMRAERNREMRDATLAQRGQYSFGTAPASHEVAIEGHLRDFQPLPVLDHYFNEIVATLDHAGIDAIFLPMPVNDATFLRVTPALREGFAAYLHGYAARYRHFRIAGEIIPHQPDSAFGDEYCHLNPPAALTFSDELAQRLHAAPPRTQKDAQNGWLRDTGAEASASVAPSSKRGS